MNEQYNLDFKFHTNSSVKRKVWGISFSVMSIMFIGVILLSTLCSWLLYTADISLQHKIYTSFILLIVGVIGLLLVNWISVFFTRNIQKKVLFSAPFEFIFWISILTGLLSYLRFSNENINVENILLVSLIPIGILFVSGLIYYFDLIKQKVLIILGSLLSFGLLIMFIISFFVLNIQPLYSIISILLISIFVAIEIYTAKKEIESMNSLDNKEINLFGLYLGVRLFSSSIALFYHILLLFFGRNRK
ncbi:hypothetical protein NWE59_02960 [Mycoplasmopsis felis]|uniref:MAG0110 family membrane protein n=1 Tax=Mycoplasmopsis felis TaxID=33923 RepID=UPI0021AFA9B5|nr:hypothetical protein [Mycoplasmopsis felis]UWV78985.1 hypothetical protein NWE59_02960 [Mycoplasmopsis felis]